MNTSSRPLSEMELQLISRQSVRRQEAIQILRGDSSRQRWVGWLGAALWVLVPIGASRYGEGFATFLGLTKDGLGWTCILLVAVLVLAFQGFVSERKLKALTHLMLDDPDFPAAKAMPPNARGGG